MMNDDERQEVEQLKTWVDLVDFEDNYCIRQYDGAIIKKKNSLDNPNNDGRKYCFQRIARRMVAGWDKVRLNNNGVISDHYVAILFAKTFLPNPNNYKYVAWINSGPFASINHEISWVEFKGYNSRQAVFD